ncbi:anhydro-N-acetylmuramic acid kinase [Palleronia sediminis]|uniref:Anhydro-N-acetylmuramic acid kinase n=1 Tax=Palleronia sediminis TaxID=2547833 RepID=A0A4R6AIS5_9RHOB|nr:anhydro-N-acetylmuramic acid kinase [Palleronia sediminis]TDL84111.1 anhydro-N-acetylmuramic acid kinase [Palleronia sediminis]
MLRDRLREGPVWALGTMSGTSLDGVDAAMVLTDGEEVFALGDTAYRPYSEAERSVLRAALGRWDGLEDAAAVVEGAHAELLAGMGGAELVGFHGQTTAHDPGGRGTCQIGDGRLLAHALDLPVVWDFRSADVALGGQGAPLAPFYHHALARRTGASAPVAFLNLGGVANLTWCDPSIADPAAPGACLAFDTGPANAPLDDLVAARRGLGRDEDGALALAGRADAAIVARAASHGYVARIPPKSLDRDDFAWALDAVAGLGDEDAAATLVAICAETVSAGLGHCPHPPARVLVCGGGRLNPAMMRALARRVPDGIEIAPVEDIGLDGDMIEAQAFAFLAVRVARGLPSSCPGTTGVAAAVGGGEISHPGDALALLEDRQG